MSREDISVKTYKSRISLFLVAVTVLAGYGPLLLMPEDGMMPYTIVATITMLFVLMVFRGIKYVIDGDLLKVYYFWGVHEDIKISSITKIERSRCILSSPAASLDRLAIHYNKYDVVYISPRRQEEFLEEIKKRQNSY